MPSPNEVRIVISADVDRAIQNISVVHRYLTDLAAGAARVAPSFNIVQQAAARLNESFSDLASRHGLVGGALQRISDLAVTGAASFRGLGDVARGLGGTLGQLVRTALEFTSGWTGLVNAVVAVGTAVAAAGDKFKTMQLRLEAMTGSHREATTAMSYIISIAQRAGVSIDAVSQIWARSSEVLKAYGYSTQEVARFVENLTTVIAAQSTSTEEARAVLIQFSQALSAGALRGDEFRSVMESAPGLARLIAENWQNANGTFGVSVTRLKQMAEQGQLTTDKLVDAFNRATPQITELQQSAGARISTAWQRVKNSFMEWLASMDRAIGLSTALAAILNDIAANWQVFISYVQIGSAVLLAALGSPLGMLAAIPLALNGLKDLWSATFGKAREETDLTGMSLEELQNRIAKAREGLAATMEKLALATGDAASQVDKAVGVIEERINRLKGEFSALAEKARTEMNVVVKAIEFESDSATKASQKAIEQALKTGNEVAGLYEQYVTTAIEGIAKVTDAKIQSVETQLSHDRTLITAETRNARERAEKLATIELQAAEKILEIKQEAFRRYEELYDYLTQKAEAHYRQVERLEQERINVVNKVEDVLSEIRLKGLSEEERARERTLEADKMLAEARKALQEGNYEAAKEYAQKAIKLYAEVGRGAKEGSLEEISAVEGLKKARDEYVAILEAQKQKEMEAGKAAEQAAEKARQRVEDLRKEIESLTERLNRDITINITADETKMSELREKIEQLVRDRDVLVNVKIDLEEAERRLKEQVEQIRAGEIPVDLKVRLESLEEELARAREVASRYDVAISMKLVGVEEQVKAAERQLERLNDLQTQSQHIIQSNVDEVRERIKSLDGVTTHSTHVIHVQEVREHASGGYVPHGEVFAFARGGWVPGVGDKDSVFARLEPGSFVLRKSAAKRFRKFLNRIGAGFVKSVGAATKRAVNALLTPGEYVVPPQIVRKLGLQMLYAMNAYQGGGLVQLPYIISNLIGPVKSAGDRLMIFHTPKIMDVLAAIGRLDLLKYARELDDLWNYLANALVETKWNMSLPLFAADDLVEEAEQRYQRLLPQVQYFIKLAEALRTAEETEDTGQLVDAIVTMRALREKFDKKSQIDDLVQKALERLAEMDPALASSLIKNMDRLAWRKSISLYHDGGFVAGDAGGGIPMRAITQQVIKLQTGGLVTHQQGSSISTGRMEALLSEVVALLRQMLGALVGGSGRSGINVNEIIRLLDSARATV